MSSSNHRHPQVANASCPTSKARASFASPAQPSFSSHLPHPLSTCCPCLTIQSLLRSSSDLAPPSPKRRSASVSVSHDSRPEVFCTRRPTSRLIAPCPGKTPTRACTLSAWQASEDWVSSSWDLEVAQDCAVGAVMDLCAAARRRVGWLKGRHGPLVGRFWGCDE